MNDSDFDPYHKWLSIPRAEQPANHYRLLGVSLFESDQDVIESAAQRQITHVRSFALGQHAELSQSILNELAKARATLLDAAVQAGGLKMPPPVKGSKPKQQGEPSRTNGKGLLGWAAKSATVKFDSDSLVVEVPSGRQSFITNAKLRMDGPVEFKMRVRTQASGTGRIQWRTEAQKSFPKNGQDQSFKIVGGDWQELSVPLAVDGKLIHLRLFPPRQKQPLFIDWIEIVPNAAKPEGRKRWDFRDAKTAATRQ